MSAFDKQPSTLSTSVRVSKLAINGNLLGPPEFDWTSGHTFWLQTRSK